MRFNRTNLALMLVVFMSALTFTSFANAAQKGADKYTASFAGAKANTGTVTYGKEGNKTILTLSDDFVVPETPDPHVQVVDSKGNTYLLDRLKIKGDKTNRVITLPAYVKDVQKVVIWCAFAEANLGEANFTKALKTASAVPASPSAFREASINASSTPVGGFSGAGTRTRGGASK